MLEIKVYDITNRASFLNTSKWIEEGYGLFGVFSNIASLERAGCPKREGERCRHHSCWQQDMASAIEKAVGVLLQVGPGVEGLTWQTDGKSPQKRARKRPRHKVSWAKLVCKVEPSGSRKMASCSSRQAQRQVRSQ